MTMKGYTHILMITDVSGSMWELKDDATGGIRNFLTEQDAEPGKTTLSFYEFSTFSRLIHDFAPLKDAFGYALNPTGGTALLDAVGNAVTEVGATLAAMPEDERPEFVVVMITTDGDENSSREWDKPAIKQLLTQQQETYNWAVTYQGANVDAFKEAGSLGIAANSTIAVAACGQGVASGYESASRMTKSFRGGGDFSYTQEERDKTKGGS
jgi:uncharacterized protein YegL